MSTFIKLDGYAWSYFYNLGLSPTPIIGAILDDRDDRDFILFYVGADGDYQRAVNFLREGGIDYVLHCPGGLYMLDGEMLTEEEYFNFLAEGYDVEGFTDKAQGRIGEMVEKVSTNALDNLANEFVRKRMSGEPLSKMNCLLIDRRLKELGY